MDYISQPTHQYANVAQEFARSENFSLGNYCAAPRAGDAVWFLLCHKENNFDMFVLICTPYGYLAEYNEGSDTSFSLVANIGNLISHLKNAGFRSLDADERSEFKDEDENI